MMPTFWYKRIKSIVYIYKINNFPNSCEEDFYLTTSALINIHVFFPENEISSQIFYLRIQLQL